MLEHAIEDDGRVLVSRPVDRGQHVRRRGEDVPAGSELLHAGQVLTAGQIVAAAALGRTTLQVRRPPRITTVLTGTEVVPAGRPLADHQVFDAVGPAVQALLADVGCITATLGPLGDDRRLLTATLLEAAEESDALITVGGASVGRHDHLKQVLRRHGELHVSRVAVHSSLSRSANHRVAGISFVAIVGCGQTAGWFGPWAPKAPAWSTPWPPPTHGWLFPAQVDHLPADALVEVWPMGGQGPAHPVTASAEHTACQGQVNRRPGLPPVCARLLLRGPRCGGLARAPITLPG